LAAQVQRDLEMRNRRNSLLTSYYRKAYEFLNRNDFEGAIGAYQTMLTLYEGDSSGQASTRVNIGDLTTDQKNPKRNEASAIEMFKTAYGQFQTIGDLGQAADVLVKIGKTYEKTNPEEAIRSYEKAGETYSTAGAYVAAAATYNQLAGLYNDPRSSKRNTQFAIQSYQKAVDVYTKIGDDSSEGTTLAKMADLYNTTGDKTNALATYDLAQKAFDRAKDEGGEGLMFSKKAAIYSESGEKQSALDCYKKAREEYGLARDRDHEFQMISSATTIYSDMKADTKLRDFLEELRSSYQKSSDALGEMEALRRLGDYHRLTKHDYLQALDYYQQALRGYIDLKDERRQASTYFGIGRTLTDSKRCDEAAAAYQMSIDLYTRIKDTRQVSFIRAYLGALPNQCKSKDKK
jgi:tetratricopeptide (TPR) repeat protein